MRNLPSIVFCISMAASTTAIAQEELCGDVIRFSAFNRSDFSASMSILSSGKHAMCDRDFTSEQEFQEYARSGGWLLSFGPLKNALTDSKNRKSNRIDIRESEFCTLSLVDLDKREQF